MRPMRFIIRVISFTLAVASFGALFSASAETAPLNLNSGAISELPLHYVSQPADSTLLVSAASAILIEANTGTVLYAAEGKLTAEDIPKILDSGDRTLAGPTVPPGGLYMTRLWYEDERLND